MVSFLNKHKKIIFTITVVVFVLGIFFGLGAYVGDISVGNWVAVVGKSKISYDDYERMVRIASENISKKQDLPDNDMLRKMIRDEVFKDMIVNELLYQEAKKLNMMVSDFEVAVEIANTPIFMTEGKFDPRIYANTIWSNYRMSVKEYESWRKKERNIMHFKQFLYSNLKLTVDDINFYTNILGEKAKDLLKDKTKLTNAVIEQKFLDIANYYLRQLTSKVEIKDYRKKFENNI